MIKAKTKIQIGKVVAIVGIMAVSLYPAAMVRSQAADPIAELNQQIEDRKKALAELQQRSNELQSVVDQAAGQVHDIESQISLIDRQIDQSTFAIQQKTTQIETLELEMTSVQQTIDEKNDDLALKRDQLSDIIRRLDANTRVSTLALVLTQQNFADFYGQAQATTSLSNSLKEGIGTVKVVRDELQQKQDSLVAIRDEHRQSKLQLQLQRQSVVDQRDLKEGLLEGAEQTEDQYQNLLAQAAKEEQQANATIGALEKEIQNRLSGNSNQPLPIFNSKGFVWPLSGRITAYFHDPSYPFRRFIGEHTGLDVAVPQGTPVRATADGVVSVVHDQGWVTDSAGRKIRSALNFVGLVHDQGMSSRYLHLSAVYVHGDQFVRQGEIIGLSGGLPGTVGAGTTTTGAHLHFEIRSDGLPDDPLKYLP